MREGWEYRKLNEVCEKGSSNIVISKLVDNNGDYPLFGASGMVKKINFFHQDKPYIGIVKDGAGVGRVNVYPAYSSLVGTMQYIFPMKDYSIDFIKYFLIKLDLSHCVTGATIPHIYFKDYGKKLIPIPPKSTQQLIVAELDKINELIRLKKEQLEDYDCLAQSIFYDMFGDPVENEKGWERKVMPELCDIIDGDRGKNYPKQEEFTSSGYCLFLNAKNVTKTGFDFSMCSFITKEKDEIMRKGKLQRGDLVLTTRGTIGNIAIYNSDVKYNNVRINSGMVILRLNHYIDKTMFEKQFKLHLSSIKQKIASGSAQPQLPISSMKKIKMIIPPLPLQHLFAQRIEQIERQKEEVKKAITDLETLLASRMQYWFE